MFVLCFGSWPFQGLFPTYLKSLHLDTAVITWLTMASAIGQIIGFVGSGIIAERLGRRRGLALMLAAGTISVIVLVAVVHLFVLALIAAFLSGAFLVGSSGIWGTILTENLPSEVKTGRKFCRASCSLYLPGMAKNGAFYVVSIGGTISGTIKKYSTKPVSRLVIPLALMSF
jgi:MFS family permease